MLRLFFHCWWWLTQFTSTFLMWKYCEVCTNLFAELQIMQLLGEYVFSVTLLVNYLAFLHCVIPSMFSSIWLYKAACSTYAVLLCHSSCMFLCDPPYTGAKDNLSSIDGTEREIKRTGEQRVIRSSPLSFPFEGQILRWIMTSLWFYAVIQSSCDY